MKLLALSLLLAQFSSDVNVVTLLATVRDGSGAMVTNLNKDDFRLEENGQPQEIRYFGRESDLPLKVALLIDSRRSAKNGFETERVAGHRFFDEVLRRDQDAGAVVHFDQQAETLQAFTHSTVLLDGALARLKPGGRSAPIDDGIVQSSRTLMGGQGGRKALVVISENLDSQRPGNIGATIEAVQRTDTIVYAIQVGRVGHDKGENAIERLSRETGGAYFSAPDVNQMAGIYDQIERELRSQYSIGYTPSATAQSGEYRKVQLTIPGRNLTVRTRDGYYAK